MPNADFAAAQHASRHAAGGPDAVTPQSINAAAATHTHAAADVGAAPASRFRTGTGPPNGSVSAPVGTEDTDTAGTNGAWEWLKTSGTGDTGGRVAGGDTGPRDPLSDR